MGSRLGAILLIKSMVQELGDCHWVMHLFDLSLVKSLDIGGLLREPAQVVGDQVDLLAPSASRQDHSLLVGVLREGADVASAAVTAGKVQDEEVILGVFDSLYLIQNRQGSIGCHHFDVFFPHCRLCHVDDSSSRLQAYLGFFLCKTIHGFAEKGPEWGHLCLLFPDWACVPGQSRKAPEGLPHECELKLQDWLSNGGGWE